MNPQRRRQYPSKQESPATKRPKINRASSMQAIVIFMGLILVARLFYLQVLQHDHYTQLANAEHQKKFTIPASRGAVYFRDGDETVPAVLNATVYTLYADPTAVKHIEEATNRISAILKIDSNKVKKLLQTKDTEYVVVQKRLSKAQVEELFKNKEKLKGINVIPVPQRVYPEGQLGAQALGFVNDEGVGQYGIESALNSKLSGKPGILKATTDVSGVPLSLDDATNIAKKPQNGDNIVLTIDRNIQSKVEEALQNGLKRSSATKGSVIVMDPATGAVKAMANFPSFDPAKYYEVQDDAFQKFQNRVVSDQYEAGSVIKVLTMASGINEGVVNKDSTFKNTGSVQVDDAKIKNVEQSVNGTRTMTDVLKYSLNTGVVHVLSQLGGGSINKQAREKLYGYFTDRYGFGEATGIEQAGEGTGSIYGPTTEQGNNVRYSNMSFGQGMGVTMVQTAAAFSSVINGGNYYKPHLVEGVMDDTGAVLSSAPKPVRSGVVTPQTSAQIIEMTRTALKESTAVANYMRPGYNVGGKTGTSQIIDTNTGKYTDANTIGSYLGFGGDELPRYVIMVRVDDSKLAGYSGSAAAAPIFGEISNWLIDYYNIKPM